MEKVIWSCNDYSIILAGVERLYDIASFIVYENYNHHSKGISPNNVNDEIEAIYNEEMAYATNSLYYIVLDRNGQLMGCIRTLKCDSQTSIPMEKIFQISPIDIIEHSPNSTFWHIGRFAIDSQVGFSTLKLFKQLMILAITPIIQEDDSYMLAETDSHLLRVMNALGIETKQLGKSVTYLASETIPIYSSHEGLINFYARSNHLIAA